MNAFRKAFKHKLKTAGIARHWHDTAYPGERYDAGQKEYFQDMAERHHEGPWKKIDLPVADIEHHHEGHDMSEEYIKEYAGRRQAGSAFPPIIAEPHPELPGKWKTIDGQHRLKAARLTGDKTISAYVPMKKDEIPGGLADKKKPSDFDADALRSGVEVEMEHTSSRSLAQEIAMDHLTEDPDYYKKLKTIEKTELLKGAKGDWKSEGYKISHKMWNAGGGQHVVRVTATDPQGNPAGGLTFNHYPDTKGAKFVQADSVAVHPDHRRKGIASAMYQYGEKLTGLRFQPARSTSTAGDRDDRTDEGKALWRQKNRPFGKSELLKGAARRLHGQFDPLKEMPVDRAKDVASWVGGHGDRKKVPQMSPNAHMRATNKLMRRTQWRKGQTGEREFLLHRQMGNWEHPKVVSNGIVTHDKESSWTPDLARVQQGIYQPTDLATLHDYGHIVSAWIPESKIKSYIPQFGLHAVDNSRMAGKTDKGRRGPVKDGSEQEVIVNPHSSQIHEMFHDDRLKDFNASPDKDGWDGGKSTGLSGWTWKKTMSAPPLKKGPYGPTGMDLYSQTDNARRKMGRTAEEAPIGPNKAVQATKPSAKLQAAAIAAEARAKSKKNPVKVYSRAEINKLMRSGFKMPRGPKIA